MSPQELRGIDRRSRHLYHALQAQRDKSFPGPSAYALSAGKAIISTPYLHAIELLDDERGALVPFDDPQAIADADDRALLDNGTARHAMRKRAYLYGRDMVWDRVAQQYMGSFERVYNERLRNPRATFSAQNTEKALDRLPAITLDHLHRMTDDTGILEHAVFHGPELIRRDTPRMTMLGRSSSQFSWRSLGVGAPYGAPGPSLSLRGFSVAGF